MILFKKRDKSIPSLWQKIYYEIFYRFKQYMIRNMEIDICKTINKDNSETDKIQPMISDYVNSFITIEDFKSSYLGNDEFSEYIKLPHKISVISFADVKNENRYIIYLECEIKDKYNTKILFHTEYVPYTDQKIISLIRDKKLNELIL